MGHGHLRNDYIGTVWLIRICIEFPRIGNFLADPKLLFYPRSGSRIIIPDPELLHSGSGYRTVIQDLEPELLLRIQIQNYNPDTKQLFRKQIKNYCSRSAYRTITQDPDKESGSGYSAFIQDPYERLYGAGLVANG